MKITRWCGGKSTLLGYFSPDVLDFSAAHHRLPCSANVFLFTIATYQTGFPSSLIRLPCRCQPVKELDLVTIEENICKIVQPIREYAVGFESLSKKRGEKSLPRG